MYLLEEVPDFFLDTMLMPLFKGKGSKGDLGNHRFLHLKDWPAKVYEKLVMQKVNARVRNATPEMQQGGQPKGNAMDHLVKTMTVMAMRKKEGKATVLTLLDIKKCFDKCKLQDILYEFCQAGVRGKNLRIIESLNEGTVIKIQGDVDSERKMSIPNSVGQGTTTAVDGASLMIGRVVSTKMAKGEDLKLKVGDVTINPSGFVDDIGNLKGDAAGAVDAGQRLTEAVDELSLEAHPQKTVNIFIGNKKARDKLANEVDKAGMKIQGFKVNRAEHDTYLGMVFDQEGPKESIDKSIEVRRGKALMKTQQAKALLRDPRTEAVGWLDCVRALYQGTVIPALTYSAIAWIGMNKRQRAKIEATQKECLYMLLELLPQASYAGVLTEIGLPRISHIINQLKIKYVSKLFSEKPNSEVVRVLKEQYQRDDEGLVAEVKELCVKYELPDVTEELVDDDWIKENVTRVGMEEVWLETFKSRKIPMHWVAEKKRKMYFNKPKMEAKLLFFHAVGELDLKTNKSKLSVSKFGGVQCLYGICYGEDRITHIMSCQGYRTRPPPDVEGDGFGKYLLELHRERSQRWKWPLIHVRT